MSARIDEVAASTAFRAALDDHEQAFGTFFYARLLGLEIDYGDEVCRVRLPIRDFLFNPQGSVHGGILASVLDISMGHLIHHVTGRGGSTIEMKVSFLRPARGGDLVAEGRFLRRGRRVSFMESRIADADGRIVATASATWAMPEAAPAAGESA